MMQNSQGGHNRKDYTSFDNIVKRETGASKIKDYALTLDTAKEKSKLQK